MDRGENDSGQQRSTMEMKMTKEHIPKGKREIAELDTHQWRTRSTMDLSMRNALKLNYFFLQKKVSNSIMYSSHARHVSIWCDCSYVVRGVHSIGQVWKRSEQTRQRMVSAIETSDLKLSGDLVQTSKNCDAEYGRTFNSSTTDLDKR